MDEKNRAQDSTPETSSDKESAHDAVSRTSSPASSKDSKAPIDSESKAAFYEHGTNFKNETEFRGMSSSVVSGRDEAASGDALADAIAGALKRINFTRPPPEFPGKTPTRLDLLAATATMAATAKATTATGATTETPEARVEAWTPMPTPRQEMQTPEREELGGGNWNANTESK